LDDVTNILVFLLSEIATLDLGVELRAASLGNK